MTSGLAGHILIVEDNENDLYLATFILAHEGYKVTSARDGDEGIQLATAECPDLILTDLNLGTVNGYELIRTLKANPATQHIPIVAISVFVTAPDRAKAFEAGCEGFIEKPFIWDTLIHQVQAYLPTPRTET